MAFDKPLWEAAENGEFAECESLILKKADVNWRNPDWVGHNSMKQTLQHRHSIKFESALRSLVTPSIHMQVGCIISRAHSFLRNIACAQSHFDCFERNACFGV